MVSKSTFWEIFSDTYQPLFEIFAKIFTMLDVVSPKFRIRLTTYFKVTRVDEVARNVNNYLNYLRVTKLSAFEKKHRCMHKLWNRYVQFLEPENFHESPSSKPTPLNFSSVLKHYSHSRDLFLKDCTYSVSLWKMNESRVRKIPNTLTNNSETV